ncbi:MAG TPA: phosphatase PAP2 family protein [Thermomicrobiales bacterium]|nr:phosphatase PAP2 family protein [Thermomicrobiales bacterium]
MSRRASRFESIRRIGPWTSRGFVIRASLAVLIIVTALLTNRSFLGWGLFAVFAILIVPTGRIRSFLFSFGPYAGVWFLFTALRSISDETPLARTLNLYAPEFERELFRGQLPTVTLQDRFFNPDHLHWYDYFCTGIHWSYFIVPHALAIYLWYKRPDLFRRFLGGMILLLGMGLAIYFLIPSNPPWLAPEPINSPSAPVIYRIMQKIGEQIGGGIYQASYKVIGESNPRAAMPSIHMAITFLLVFPSFRLNRWFGLLMLLYAACMGYSLIYLGEHYFIDVMAGCGIAAYGWYGFPKLSELIQIARQPGAKPILTPAPANQEAAVATPASA